MRKHLMLLLTVTVASCLQAEKEEAEAVHRVAEGIIAADNLADLEKVLSYYEDSAVLIPPGGMEIQGLQNIRKNYEGIFSASILRLSIDIDAIQVSGGTAICRGRTKGKVISKTDSSMAVVDDKFLMVLKKKNDWKITHLMWSRNR